MPLQVDVWSDFVCPFCFLAGTSVEKLQQEYDLALRWHSYELNPDGTTFSPEKLKYIQDSQPRLLRSAREQYGVELNQGPLETNSRPALVGEKYASEQGLGNEYHQAVMRAYWLERKPIDDLALLQTIAVSIGLDGAAFLTSLTQPEYVTVVEQDIEQAREYGLDGVPALVFGEKYLIVGAQPYEVLQRAIEQAQSEGL